MPHEEQPAEQQPAEQQPAEQQPAEQQPAEPQPAEPQPPEQQPTTQDEFAERTAAAEALPLPERADAFAALHDDLRTRLESGQGAPSAHSSGRAAGAGQVWGSGRGDGGARA